MNILGLKIEKESLDKSLMLLVMVSGFDLTICDSYFTILVEVFKDHILAKNIYFTNRLGRIEHKIMVLKPANKYKIIWQCHNFENILIDDFLHHPIFYRANAS